MQSLRGVRIRSRCVPTAAVAGAALIWAGAGLGARGQGSIVWDLSPAGIASYGQPVAGPGDLNGDGAPDLVMGSSWPDTTGLVTVLSGADGDILFSVTGSGPDEYFGRSIAVLGDLDGDGVAEMAVGAPGAGLPATGAGYVRVISGTTGATLFTVTGTSVGDGFGSSVDAVGDFDADGIVDFVAGSAGSARIVSAANGATLQSFGGVAGIGSYVAGVGDADGDAVPDVAVGIPYGPGSVQILSGATGVQAWTVTGSAPSEELGRSVTGPGDLNGDGLGDVVVGAISGPTLVLSGANGTALYPIPGPDNWGWWVARAGDLNADGVPDFAAGDPDPDYGTAFARLLSGANGATLLEVAEPSTWPAFGDDFFGYSVSMAGDVNGDGAPELLVGAIDGVFVYSTAPWPAGTSPLPLSPCPVFPPVPPNRISIHMTGGLPTAGNGSFRIVGSGGPVASAAILVAGISSFSPPILLPFADCGLVVYPDFLFPTTTNAAGAAAIPLPIPMSPSVVGAVVYFQWFVNAFPFSTFGKVSPGLQVTVL
ncbi:MAG TPA: VCBS repeat-containing protein [Planctomycetota bacterium]|nr:VCBS repeat-containing protein [Planctomycetota bacterium]